MENPEIKIQYLNVCDSSLRVKRIVFPSCSNHNPVLVFLHEGLGCIEIWRDFPEKLCRAAGYSGLVYDRIGYGGSKPTDAPWPRDYLITESTRYLPGLLKACGVGRAILIGHSDGGTIALLTAAEAPDLIHAVITEAAHIFVEQDTINGIREAVNAYKNGDLKEKLSRYHGVNTDYIFYRWADRWLDPDFREWNIESYLPHIECPLLVIQGEEDEYATKAQVDGIADQVSGRVDVAMIPACSHIPHFQSESCILGLMSMFIKWL